MLAGCLGPPGHAQQWGQGCPTDPPQLLVGDEFAKGVSHSQCLGLAVLQLQCAAGDLRLGRVLRGLSDAVVGQQRVCGQCGPGSVAERRGQQFVNVAVADVAARAGLQGLVGGARQCFEHHASSFRFTSPRRGRRTRLSPRRRGPEGRSMTMEEEPVSTRVQVRRAPCA